MIWEYLDKINMLDKRNKVTQLSVPGHTGMKGDEISDVSVER